MRDLWPEMRAALWQGLLILLAVFVLFGMYTGSQISGHIFVGKLFFTRRLDDMALGQTIDLLGRLVRYFLNVRMASFTFDFGMHALVEYIFVYKQEPEFTFFIHPAEAGIFVAQETVADIGGIR